MNFLSVDAVDYCGFGNSKPFRIKIRNILNDNFLLLCEACRCQSYLRIGVGTHAFTYNLNYLVFQDTLVKSIFQEFWGCFYKRFLPNDEIEKSQLAKEFVKFNERCMIRLLGDMRSYNYGYSVVLIRWCIR